MTRIVTVAGAMTVALGLATLTGLAETPPPRNTAGIADAFIMAPSGTYASPDGRVRIAVRSGGIAEIESSSRWEAVGYFDGRHFVGLMRTLDDIGIPATGKYGSVRFTFGDSGTIEAVLGFPGGTVRKEEHWIRQAKPQKPPLAVTPPTDEEPKFGEYVYVEELPEAITKVQPMYPPGLNIDGDILVQALVGKDGLVKDTKVVKSIPGLDAAAVEAVRQWRFKPALSKGKPVSVWVAVPIRFALR